MGIFKKKADKEIVKSTLNPMIMEGFLNKIKDIVCIANYDGTIEVINNPEINEKYKTITDFFSGAENPEIYRKIIDEVMDQGCYIDDIEIYKNEEKVRMYIAAYNVPSLKKIFFYIKDTNKYFEKEIELLEEIDRQDEYLKSKDLFIANLSHEIRTPINIIVGMIYFLKDTNLDEKQLEYVNKLDEASNLLLEMVNGILDLSEEKNYSAVNTKTDFNLKSMIDNVVEMFDIKISEKNLKLYLSLNIDDDVNVYADKARLSQVFVNLLSNAVKYTDKGFIEIDGKKVEENNVCYKFQFCFKDTGIGIKREDTLRIFREFQQVDDPTRKVKEGKGMGLAIAKKIVEDMEGKMWVESSIGLGSKFYFNIVIDKSNKTYEEIQENENQNYTNRIDQISESIENPSPQTTKRILLVEDNDLNIEITLKIIEETPYVCDVVKDGIQAIKQIKEMGSKYYDLILMDIHMPRYNGYEISKILKKDLDLSVPIVALTATVITPEIIRENQNYIQDYIQKPIKPAEFKEKLKSYLEVPVLKENVNKKHVLLFYGDESKMKYLKNRLSTNYSVATTKSELDAQILLETGNIDAILVDELDDLEKEFKFINNIKCDAHFKDNTIVLINRKEESDLKKKAYEYGIRDIIETFEIEKCDIALNNILNKKDREENLEKTIEASKMETENAYNFLFESMVNLTTSRSKETGEHLKRTQLYMQVMLKKYEEFYHEGLFNSKKVIEDISMAAVLHDIGKVGVPDSVLNKPGKLTDEEYEIIKSHVIIGRNILETSYGNKVNNNILKYAKDIVYHHHEKFDGTGYPEGLKGEEISIISRIMSVTDVYDALANDRVYKKAMPYDEVEKYIEDQAGKAFDPKVVNVFKFVKDDIRKINEANKDNTIYQGK